MTDSMPIVTIFVAVLAFGLIDAVGIYAVDQVIANANQQILEGTVTQATHNYLSYSLDLWRFAPFAFLLGLCTFVFERSKGKDLPSELLIEYEVVLILGVIFSTILVFCFGLISDRVLEMLWDAVGFILPQFDTMEFSNIALKCMYMALLVPAVLSSLFFMIFPVTTQRDTTWFTGEVDESTGEGYGQEQAMVLNPKQF